MALEERPIDIHTNGGINIYEIDSTEHADHYDFEDSDDIIDIFLLNVHSKFALLEQEMVVKYDFKLQNIPPPPAIFAIRIIHSYNSFLLLIRCWSTNIYRKVNFKDFLFYALRETIKKESDN